MTRRAFTLIELLVVIAVIAILAALLFPVFARARRSAYRTQCVSNLRHLSVAMQQYVEDWDQRYPAAHCDDSYGAHGGRPGLKDAMWAYVPDARIWQCPEDKGETYPRGPLGWRRRTPPCYAFYSFSSYFWPGLGPPFNGSNPRTLGKRPISDVKKPTITPLLWEARPWHSNYNADENYSLSPNLYNVLYCDGHIATEPVSVFKFAHQYHADD